MTQFQWKDSALFFFKNAGMVVGLFWEESKRNGSFGTDRKTERAQWSCMFGHDWRYIFQYTELPLTAELSLTAAKLYGCQSL